MRGVWFRADDHPGHSDTSEPLWDRGCLFIQKANSTKNFCTRALRQSAGTPATPTLLHTCLQEGPFQEEATGRKSSALLLF